MHTNETIELPAGTEIFYEKSEAQLAEEMASDRRMGRFHDDAGESILYSKIGARRLKGPIFVQVTKVRGVKWPTWSRKPKFLREGNPVGHGMFTIKFVWR